MLVKSAQHSLFGVALILTNFSSPGFNKMDLVVLQGLIYFLILECDLQNLVPYLRPPAHPYSTILSYD